MPKNPFRLWLVHCRNLIDPYKFGSTGIISCNLKKTSWKPDTIQPQAAYGVIYQVVTNQALRLKQGELANLSKESLDTDMSVGVNSASGFLMRDAFSTGFAHACPGHAFVSGAIDIGLLQSLFLTAGWIFSISYLLLYLSKAFFSNPKGSTWIAPYEMRGFRDLTIEEPRIRLLPPRLIGVGAIHIQPLIRGLGIQFRNPKKLFQTR